MDWNQLKEEAEKIGWYSIKPTKEEVDIKCNGKDYQYFSKKYDEFVCNEDIPLRFYKDCSIFCDTNDVDFMPILIQIVSSYDQMLAIMKALQ